MKKIFLLLITGIIFHGCSASVDTANMAAEQRLQYAITLYNDESFDVAIPEFESILLQFPGSEVVDDAQFYLAKCRLNRKEYIMAAFEFSRLIKNMPASEFVIESQYLLAESYYKLSPDFTLDQRYTKKSIEEFQAFIDFFPTDQRVTVAEQKISEMNNKLAQKEYTSAIIYEKLEYYTAAIKYYGNVVEVFHDTEFAPKASYNKIKLLIQRERIKEAVTEVNSFLSKYPLDKAYSDVLKLKDELSKLSSI
jgi:outer membrane protein assembly factor BamD